MKKLKLLTSSLCLAVFAMAGASAARAVTVDPYYSGSYTAASIGSVPDVPTRYGGLTFLDSNTILIGGTANTSSGRLYTIDVTRGPGGHITGFSGNAAQYGGPASAIGDYNDGGVVFGPGGVLFLARWPIAQIGQVKPGTTADEDRVDAGPPGAIASVAALNFVPASFSGAGNMKVVTWASGEWYNVGYAPDGNGTYNLGPFTQIDVDPTQAGVQNVPGGPEGFTYIAAGNPLFTANSILITDYSAGTVTAYEVDANGDPLINTGQTFLSSLSGAEGAAIDPLTGDFLFSTFGGNNEIVVVQGFNAPEPSSLVLAAIALVGVGYTARRKR